MATMKRVVVMTLSAKARDLAVHVGGTVKGNGLVVGEMDDDAIQKLRDAGSLVDVLPDDGELEAVGFVVVNSPLESFSGSLPQAPVDVELTTSGPFLPEWKQQLAGMGVTQVEGAGSYRLRAHVADKATLEKVAALSWVVGVRKAEPAVVPAASPPLALPINGPPLPMDDRDPAWDVSVTGAADAKLVQDWAAKNGLEVVVGSSARRVRVRVPAGKEQLLAALAPRSKERFVPPVLLNDLTRARVGIPADARARVGADDVSLTGRDQIVGVADSGLDDAHPDFAGRVLAKIARGRPGDTSDPHGHGTHVSGTILGSGAASDGKYRGLAPEATIVLQSLLDGQGRLDGLPVELGELFGEALAAGARIHNNSWGLAAQSRYRAASEDVDAFVAAHPEMLIVIAAGNDGTTVVDQDMPSSLEPGRVQPLSLTATATSKNALVVGASRSSRSDGGGLSLRTYAEVSPGTFPPTGKPADVAVERFSGDPEQPAAFSGRGPCDDRRIKPDVVAPGTDIVSARSSIALDKHFSGVLPGGSYGYMAGTSMATPVVTGFAALVREYYVRHRGVAEPSAALLKATIVNGTRVLTGADAGGPVPNGNQGFGCVHLPTTLPSAEGMKLAFLDVPAAGGFTDEALDKRSYTFDVVATGDVRICLAFTDLPGRSVQNGLSLVVEVPGVPSQTIPGNKDLRGRLYAWDSDNNVQIVRVPAAPAGQWTAWVTCSSLHHGPQGFALVVLGPLSDEVLQVV